MRNRCDGERNDSMRRFLIYCRRHLRFCYGYCCCYLLLTVCILPLLNAANVVNSATKLSTKGNIVEGSGAFGGDAANDSEWHSSGSSPDDEPGDEDVEEGSGSVIEGSGISIQTDRSRIAISTTSSTVFASSSTVSTRKQAEDRFTQPSYTSSSVPPFLVNTSPVPTTISTTPYIVPRTTQTTTTTKKPIVVVNTRPPLQIPQPEPPYIADAGESFEMLKPGILAAVSGGAVVGVLMTILLVMFIVYRMRKKDEGSYSLDEPHQPPNYSYAYQKASTKEFYA